MEIQPLLTFTTPSLPKKIDKLPPGFGSEIFHPTASVQFQKFYNKISNINQKLSQYVSVQDHTNGLIPERALVIEIKGKIDTFYKAIAKVDGFEFVTSSIISDDTENQDIYILDENGEKTQPVTTAYMMLSNHDGLVRLLSIWKKYIETGTVDKGFTPLANALELLNDIRLWDTRDRLNNTYLLEDWNEKVTDPYFPDEMVSFEIEIWFRKNKTKQRQAELSISKEIELLDGRIKNKCIIDEIGYHAVVGEIPIKSVNKILCSNIENIELMRCDDVMFFRPLGQCIFGNNTNDAFESDISIKDTDTLYDNQDPIIALLDGLPLEQHSAISNKIQIDDPDSFADAYSSPQQQEHGTSMASLIINGDLNEKNVIQLPRPIYIRPILKPRPAMHGRWEECIPADILPIDLIHRSVRRIFEGDAGDKPLAPNIKVINLSVCDRYRLFDTQISPFAKMIDWLSYKYKVLFIISAGNHQGNIKLPVNLKEFQNLNPDDIHDVIYEQIEKERLSKRMMSPAEAQNAITVKASHKDESNIKANARQIEPSNLIDFPSTINPITLGYNRCIKPELLMPGGRITYENKTLLDNQPVNLSISRFANCGPGHRVAAPSPNQGALNHYLYTVGTSNATALATRRLGFLYETLSSMRSFGDDKDALSQAPDSIILKAMLCHGAEINYESRKKLQELFQEENCNQSFDKSNEGHFFGYGHVNEERIHHCTNNQATLIRTGKIKGNKAHTYKFPLPPSLSSKRESRRLILTLAWLSPINPHHREYLSSQLWISDPKKQNKLLFGKGDYYHHNQKKGTIYHEIIHGDKVSAFTKDDYIEIQVNCKCRAGMAPSKLQVEYALIVTLDTESVSIPVYDEVKNQLELYRKIESKGITN